MDRLELEALLARLNTHPGDRGRHIRRQRATLALLTHCKRDTRAAEKLLDTLEELQALNLARRDRVVLTLAASRDATQPTSADCHRLNFQAAAESKSRTRVSNL